MKLIHAAILSVNLTCVSTAALAQDDEQQPTKIDLCYVMVGIAMIEHGAIKAITREGTEADGYTFNVKLDKAAWNELEKDTKSVLKSCLSEFNALNEFPPSEDEES